MSTTISALGAASILAGVAVMQVAMALGAPWGAHVYGGRAAGPGEALPVPYRAMSAIERWGLGAATATAAAMAVLVARSGPVAS